MNVIMLSKILDFFKPKTSIEVDKNGNQASDELKIATAVLLFSVAGADSDFDPVEVRSTFSLIAKSYGLNHDQTMSILSKAEEKFKTKSNIDKDVDFVNSYYTEKQRQLIYSLAWQVVCSDGKIENHERKYASQLRNKLQLSREQAQEAKSLAENKYTN